MTSISQVSYFTPFCSTAAIFYLQAILRQVHWMRQKWPQILKTTIVPALGICVWRQVKFDIYQYLPKWLHKSHCVNHSEPWGLSCRFQENAPSYEKALKCCGPFTYFLEKASVWHGSVHLGVSVNRRWIGVVCQTAFLWCPLKLEVIFVTVMN